MNLVIVIGETLIWKWNDLVVDLVTIAGSQ